MPDGDKYHSKLSWHYQEAYKGLCERKCDHNENVWNLKKALLLDIKKNYGVSSVQHAKRIGKMLQEAIENAVKNNSVDWSTLSTEIDRQVRQSNVTHYVKGLLYRASKGILHEFRYNQRVDNSNLPKAVVERLFQEIYKSNFEERIPLTSNHHAGLDHATVMELVETQRPDILDQISKWAKTATVHEDLKNLRRSPREKVKEIDLDEDLL